MLQLLLLLPLVRAHGRTNEAGLRHHQLLVDVLLEESRCGSGAQRMICKISAETSHLAQTTDHCAQCIDAHRYSIVPLGVRPLHHTRDKS